MTATDIPPLQPGDVCAVRTGGWAAWWIRLGSALRGQPNLDNHIIVVDHIAANGVIWGIEGRPGGVGPADVSQYFTGVNGSYAVTNVLQPKTQAQRTLVVAAMRHLAGTPYDWPAIAEDGIQDLHLGSLEELLKLEDLWSEKGWGNGVPGHVVCSSAAIWGYRQGRLLAPETADMRHTEPSDWTQFSLEHHYN